MKAAWQGFNLTTKISLIFTILMLVAIPATVLSVNTIRDQRSKAAGSLGDPNYPDPVASWSQNPEYRMDLCLNTTDRSSSLCNKDIFVNNNHSYTTQALNNFRYYWYVMMKDYTGKWLDYQQGSWFNSCFNAGGTPQQLCDKTITWAQPYWSAQATYDGSLKNACDGSGSTYCDSTREVAYPGKQVQFVDLPQNITIDVYVHVRDTNILFTTINNIQTGGPTVTSAPTLSIPKYGETGVTTNNTPFAWSTVPGASYYALWVSTGPNFVDNGFWYKNIPPTACNSSSCIANWNTIPWSTKNGNIGPFPPPPSSLEKGKTYYWAVWACSASDCPLVGLSQTWNFRTESPVTLPPNPAGLKDSDARSSVPPGIWGETHKFEWVGANSDTFAVDISSDPNFNSGHFVNKVINVVSSNALTNYSVFGDSGWANQGSADYASGGKLALKENVKYYWRVFARNSAGSVYSAIPNKEVIKPPMSQPVAGPLQPAGLTDSDSLATVPPGIWGKTHIFRWIGANANLYAVDVSSDSSFNTYVHKVIFATAAAALTPYTVTGDGGWVNQGGNYTSGGNLALQETTTYYWRVFAYNSQAGIGLHSTTPYPTVKKPPTGTSSTLPKQPSILTTNIEALICGNTGVRYGAGLVFRWIGSNTTEYAVDVSESPTFSGFANKVVNGNTFSITGDTSGGVWTDRFNAVALTANGSLSLSPNKTYYWRVWAKNDAGSVYDVLYSAANPQKINLPLCSVNFAPQLVSPPRNDASQQPVFNFKPSTASYYGIGVSDNKDDLLSFRRLWKSYITSSQCGPLGCIRNWVDANWYEVGSIGPKPISLTPGKTYYWYVWACTSTDCPLNGLVSSDFTVAGSINQTPPTNLSAEYKESLPEVVKFSWTPASTNDGVIDHYRVLIKDFSTNSNDFNKGDYWIKKSVSPLICYGKPNCTIDNSGTWEWVQGTSGKTYPNLLPKPLFKGSWVWVVLACKTPTCDLANVLPSSQNFFHVLSYGSLNVVATALNPTVPQYCLDGFVVGTLKWTSAEDFVGTTENEAVDLSVYDNNFLPGTYKTLSQSASLFNPNTETGLVYAKFADNTKYFWRVNTIRDGFDYPSATASFTTMDCPDAPPPSGGMGNDLEKSGTPSDVQNYIRQIAGGDVDLLTGLNLADVMIRVIGKESGGGQDCAYHVDTRDGVAIQSTIGIFQFSAETWQGQTTIGSFETGNYIDSGGIFDAATNSRRFASCWKHPGLDDVPSLTGGKTFWADAFQGPGFDASAWNPYAQARAARKFFLKPGQACGRWSASYGTIYGVC